jgi:hypothetical protein
MSSARAVSKGEVDLRFAVTPKHAGERSQNGNQAFPLNLFPTLNGLTICRGAANLVVQFGVQHLDLGAV